MLSVVSFPLRRFPCPQNRFITRPRQCDQEAAPVAAWSSGHRMEAHAPRCHSDSQRSAALARLCRELGDCQRCLTADGASITYYVEQVCCSNVEQLCSRIAASVKFRTMFVLPAGEAAFTRTPGNHIRYWQVRLRSIYIYTRWRTYR